MNKINMKNTLVEINGDEMTRVIWENLKNKLILPFINLKTKYYDLGLKNRNLTNDKITIEAANAIKKYKVAVKCATITPNHKRKEEYNLKKIWNSPNATIRSIIGGTIFRKPIYISCIKNSIRNWEKPITIARHAYGDVYKDVELEINEPGEAFIVYKNLKGKEKKISLHKFKNKGIILGMHNLENSIKEFAYSCFDYALNNKEDLWFGTKDTISKIYDYKFKNIFEKIFNKEYKKKFNKYKINYFYSLIDDIFSRIISSKGGFLIACKNYDGDIISDMIASAFGSLALMTSVLISSNGEYEYEAAHGTITKHYYKYMNREKTSTNSIATIFAWSGAIRKIAELEKNKKLILFSNYLENSVIETVKSGKITKDLANKINLKKFKILDTFEFLNEIKMKLKSKIIV